MKRFYLILFLLWTSWVFSQEKVIVLTDTTSLVKINPYAEFIESDNNKFPDFSNKENVLDYGQFSKIQEFPVTVKTIWAKAYIENKSSSSQFYINAVDYVSQLHVYELVGNDSKLIGETGFTLRTNSLSIKKDKQNIHLRIFPGEKKELVFKIDSYRNDMFFNSLNVISEKKFLQESQLLREELVRKDSRLILFFVGIHFCLAILGIARLRVKFFRKSIFIFILLNIFYIIFYTTDYDFLDLENSLFPKWTNSGWVHFFGAIEPALYYVFFWSYLDKNRIFRRVVLYSGLFWIAFYFVTNIEWSTDFMVKLSRFFRSFGPVYDLVITAAVFGFLLRYRSTFHKYARLGVFILLLSAIQLSFPFILGLLGITAKNPRFISENAYFIMFVAIVLDFMLFLYGQNKNEMQVQAEKEAIEKQLLLNEVERQKSILEERRRISHDMHDDLGAGISAMKLQAEFLKKKTTDENLYEDIDDLVKTSEDMNLSMRELLWNLNTNNDNVGDFVQYSSTYAEVFFRKTNIKLHITKYVNDEKAPLFAEFRRNLFLSYKEALNNVYKHSNAQKAIVVFEQTFDCFSICIEDNGVGISSGTSYGNGIKNMEQRISECNGRFEILKSETGTKVKFIVPLPDDKSLRQNKEA